MSGIVGGANITPPNDFTRGNLTVRIAPDPTSFFTQSLFFSIASGTNQVIATQIDARSFPSFSVYVSLQALADCQSCGNGVTTFANFSNSAFLDITVPDGVAASSAPTSTRCPSPASPYSWGWR